MTMHAIALRAWSPAIHALGGWLERRRQHRALLQLPDAMLKDMGVSRCDAWEAWREARKPFWRA
jgi:uncharacterized protein YjiS (DUF1127 family)